MFNLNVSPRILPTLDAEFMPASLMNRAFLAEVNKSSSPVKIAISIERSNNLVSTFHTVVFEESHPNATLNFSYIERLVKSLLWIRGGWKITIAGSTQIADYIKQVYSAKGIRSFDADLMSSIYEKEFLVQSIDYADAPCSNEISTPIGRNLDGCRIGFDAGGSDRKVAAVIDGNAVYTEEVIWHPKNETDPDYHYNEIKKAFDTAASKMPKVDAIGVSAAGIYVNNRIMAASLFIKVPKTLFDLKVKNMFIDLAEKMGNIPIEVANDGDVTALAGSMDLSDTNVLGIAMGTSEAGGFIDSKGNITGWLNELAFVPVDFNPKAMIDEWSGDFGCGVKYFSQDAVIKLAANAGITFNPDSTPAEKLEFVQKLYSSGNQGAREIFDSIGCYLGYAIAHYCEFYEIKHVLILGRVTSGDAGNTIINAAKKVLEAEFPEIHNTVKLHLPDEKNKRVGQSIAAASLVKL